MQTRDTHRAGEEIAKAPSTQVGKELQTKKIVLGGSPHTVNLAAEGLEPMEDTDYVVQLQGETVARITVDESTITTDGFDILGGANTEVAHVSIHGVIASRNPK